MRVPTVSHLFTSWSRLILKLYDSSVHYAQRQPVLPNHLTCSRKSCCFSRKQITDNSASVRSGKSLSASRYCDCRATNRCFFPISVIRSRYCSPFSTGKVLQTCEKPLYTSSFTVGRSEVPLYVVINTTPFAPCAP